MRIKVQEWDHGATLDERIMRACQKEEDNGESIENSVFYVSRQGWLWFARYEKTATLELSATGYRIVLPTWFGVVYIVGDKLLGEFDSHGEQTIEVEWGDSMTYEECIRQGELWMARADAKRPIQK